MSDVLRTRSGMDEEYWEGLTIEVLGERDWRPLSAGDIAPGTGERESWAELTLMETLHGALKRLNPEVPAEYLRQAAAEALRPQSQDAIAENARMHDILVRGYRKVSYVDQDGVQHHPVIRFLSSDPDQNVHHAVRQVRVVKQHIERRFDVVLYLNGLPVAIMELKNAAERGATAKTAYDQLRTYVRELPMVFRCAVVVLASDGVSARYGTPFTPWNHFAAWNVDEDGALVDTSDPGREDAVTELELTLHGLFDTARFTQILREFVAFDETAEGLVKRVAKPHQYFAVCKAVGCTVQAVPADGRAGVVWHTQGSGKSMEMELYAAKVIRHPKLANPTIVVVTDRNELDGQLYETFNRSTLMPEAPVQVTTREQLREELSNRRSGGIYFTTLQKFGLSANAKRAGGSHPVLTERRNVIVIVDEAHRSHYDDLDGYAHHLRTALPRATHIAFTGTPVSETDRDTRRVFGDDIDIYDMHRAEKDGATVPVRFESRLIELERVAEIDDQTIDAAADEITAGLDETEREKIKRAVATMETIYGAPERLKVLAKDIVEHWEQRRERMSHYIGGPGKALIVVSTRSIGARLYEEIAALRPDWVTDEDSTGRTKAIFTTIASDPEAISAHRRRPSELAAVKNRLKNPDDELELAIVKDMLLTGFDAPPMHTVYLDRPMRGALLMQTLARVNRTFRSKQDGLLVAYAPIEGNLVKALKEFTRPTDGTEANRRGRTVDEAIPLVEELVGSIRDIVGEDWRATLTGDPQRGYQRATIRMANILRSPSTPGNRDPENPDARPKADEFRHLSSALERAWAWAGGDARLAALRPEIRFYIDVRVIMGKLDAQARLAEGRPIPEELQHRLGAVVVDSAQAVGVMDIYREAGLELPTLRDLSPDWLEKAKQPDHAHLAIEKLRADLLAGMREATAHNELRERQFSEQVNELMYRYTNQQLTAAQVLEALVRLSEEVVEEAHRGERFDPPLTAAELAFYDVIAQEKFHGDELGDDILAMIAREIVETLRRDARIDWTAREDVKAKLRSQVKRLLRKHKYPPQEQAAAYKAVLEKMETMTAAVAS